MYFRILILIVIILISGCDERPSQNSAIFQEMRQNMVEDDLDEIAFVAMKYKISPDVAIEIITEYSKVKNYIPYAPELTPKPEADTRVETVKILSQWYKIAPETIVAFILDYHLLNLSNESFDSGPMENPEAGD